MSKRFIRTGKYKGCYKLGDIKDTQKGRRVCSVQMPDLGGEPYILDLLNELNEENEQLKSEINMLKVTIGRNEAHIKRLTETSNWRTSAYD